MQCIFQALINHVVKWVIRQNQSYPDMYSDWKESFSALRQALTQTMILLMTMYKVDKECLSNVHGNPLVSEEGESKLYY